MGASKDANATVATNHHCNSKSVSSLTHFARIKIRVTSHAYKGTINSTAAAVRRRGAATDTNPHTFHKRRDDRIQLPEGYSHDHQRRRATDHAAPSDCPRTASQHERHRKGHQKHDQQQHLSDRQMSDRQQNHNHE